MPDLAVADRVRALVTGANGFVGRYLAKELLERGYSVFGGTHGPDGASDTDGDAHPGAYHRVPLDVTSIPSIRSAVEEARPELVFHLAGQSSVRSSFAEPLTTWDVNATGTLRLLHVLQQRESVRVLVVSSAEVYGVVPEMQQPIRETAPLRPTNPYAASKAAAEMAALTASKMGRVRVVVARSFNHTGPGQDERFALPSFARQLARLAQQTQSVLRVGNLDARRDFLDVRDVARAYVCLLETGESGTVYNVCSGEARQLKTLVETLVDLSGGGARIVVDPQRVRPIDVPLLVGDPSRLRALGWEPLIPLRQTLADMLTAARAESSG